MASKRQGDEADNNQTIETSSMSSKRADDIAASGSASSYTELQQSTLSAAFETKTLLVTTFGFDPELAIRAVEAIDDKSDVTMAYNWILDTQEGIEDKGGPVIPKTDCPHVLRCVAVSEPKIRFSMLDNSCSHFRCMEKEESKNRRTGGLKCDYASDDESSDVPSCPAGENWMCLQCGVLRCSRYVNGHCLNHWEVTKANDTKHGTGHCISVSLSDLSVWCYMCQAYLINDTKLGPLLKLLEAIKFAPPTVELSTSSVAASE